MSDFKLTIPDAAAVCLLEDIRIVTLVPHAAQESLSSSSTPTLSYSLPLYHSVVDKWEQLQHRFPLLAPYIEVGIQKVTEYINKSQLSRTYLLAVCKSRLYHHVACTLTRRSPVLNPCLKLKWVEKNCLMNVVWETKAMALDAVSFINTNPTNSLTLGQMLTFKMAHLKAQQENYYAYTTAPSHQLKSVTASAISFLGNDWDRSPSPVQRIDSGGERDLLLNGLRTELDDYLAEPRMLPHRLVHEGSDTTATVQWCDPLLYWTVRTSLHLEPSFSTALTVRRTEIPSSLSTRDGHPPRTSIRGSMRTTLFIEQRNVYSPPKSDQP